MSKIFNIDLSYAKKYEGIEADSAEEALEIALERWGDCIPNHTIECVHETTKHYTHPFSDKEFDAFEDAKHDLLTNYKEKLHAGDWYWDAFGDMIEEGSLDESALYNLIYGTNEYRKYLFELWEKKLDKKVCESAIEEKEITI